MVLCLCLVQFWYQNKKSDQTAYLNQPNKNPTHRLGESPVQPPTVRRRPCLVETPAARSCRPPSIHPSWRSNNRRNRRSNQRFPCPGNGGEWGWVAKKSLGLGGEDFFFLGRMMMLFWWYTDRWNFGQGNWRWDLSKGKLHGLNSGLVPRFQRHQDVEGSAMLMNWSVFLPVKWLVHQILIWVSKIGKALEKTSGFL